MPVLSEIRPCCLTVVLVRPDAESLRAAPGGGGMWLLRIRLAAADYLSDELSRLVVGLPVRLEVSVVAEGRHSVEIAYDDDGGCWDLARALSEAVADRLSEHAEMAFEAAVLAVGPPAPPAEDRSECPDCIAGVPLPLGYINEGDRYWPAGAVQGEPSQVVALDAAAGVLVVDSGDGPVLVGVDAAGWDAEVVRAP